MQRLCTHCEAAENEIISEHSGSCSNAPFALFLGGIPQRNTPGEHGYSWEWGSKQIGIGGSQQEAISWFKVGQSGIMQRSTAFTSA